MGHEKLLHQRLPCKQPVLSCKSETLDTRSCCIRSLLGPRCCVEGMLRQHRASCVTFKAVQDANSAAIPAKTTAVSNGKPWFVYAVDEQAERQAAQAAENEACQLQQDNKGVVIVCEGQVHVGIRGRPLRRLNFAAALKAYQAVLQEMPTAAEAALKSVSGNTAA